MVIGAKTERTEEKPLIGSMFGQETMTSNSIKRNSPDGF
jgi:hypothetical protein